MKLIDAIFENGVFRPLVPLRIPERHRMVIAVEDSDFTPIIPAKPTRMKPLEYITDEAELQEEEYVLVPPKMVRTITAKIIRVGKAIPITYQAE